MKGRGMRRALMGSSISVLIGPLLKVASAAASTIAVPISTMGPDTVTVFVHVAVIPMDRERVLRDQTVVVRGDHIVALGPSAKVPVPADARRIDGTGKYLIPGLADMHAHAADVDTHTVADLFFTLVANGVTTIRDMHSSRGGPQLLAFRRRVESGGLLGPHIYTVGDPSDSTAEAAAASIPGLKMAGYDFVKVSLWGLPGKNRSVFDSINAAAKRVGFRVVGHVPPGVTPLETFAAGWASTEHLYEYTEYLLGLTGRWSRTDGGLLFFRAVPLADTAVWMKPRYRLDSAKLRELALAAQRSGTWQCPTLYTMETFAAANEKAAADPMSDSSANSGTWFSKPELRARARVLRRYVEFDRQITKALRDAGAGLLLGTDFGYGAVAGFSIHDELAALIRAGLTPYQALETGTRNAAEFLGTLDSAGTIAVGKRADLVLLDGNPLKEIRYTAWPAGVMIGGRWLPRSELAGRMDDIVRSDSALAAARDRLWRSQAQAGSGR